MHLRVIKLNGCCRQPCNNKQKGHGYRISRTKEINSYKKMKHKLYFNYFNGKIFRTKIAIFSLQSQIIEGAKTLTKQSMKTYLGGW